MFGNNPFKEHRAAQEVQEISKGKLDQYVKAADKDKIKKYAQSDMGKVSKDDAYKNQQKRNKGIDMAKSKMKPAKVAAQEAVEYPHMMYDPKTGKEVKAKTPADHAKYSKMGYTHDKPKMDEGTQYVIPEEIPANERTAFHGAAAAAAKAGKSHFNFGGKKHPVTMKKDTAKAIADDSTVTAKGKYRAANNPFRGGRPTVKTEGAMKDLATNKTEPNPKSDEKVVADFKKRRKMKKDEKSDVNMNPKVDNEKADKGSAMETKESTIREKLIAVLEGDRAKHYKGATKPEGMHDKTSPGGKEMMNQPKETDDTVKKSHDDASKAGKTGKTAKQRGGGDMVRSGDQKIVPGGTPMKGMKGTMEAYTSMYEKEETDGN